MRFFHPRQLVLILAVAFAPRLARASSDYPDLIRTKLGLARVPDCTLCHSDDNGGNGTIVTWFGLSMQDFGVQGKRDDLLDAALDRVRDEEWDSDADGIPDVEELQSGSDPNDGPGRTGGPPRPDRGCATTVGETHRSTIALPGLLLVAVFALKRLRWFRTASAWSQSRLGRASREYRA